MSLYWQGTIWFEGSYGGWSEIWYPKSSVASGALLIMDNFLPLRMACSPPAVTAVRMEVSDLTVRGDAYLSTTTPMVGTYADTANMQPPWDALLVALETGTGGPNGRKFMRGLPANCVSNGKWNPNTTFNTNFAAMAAMIVPDMQHLKRFPSHVFVPFNIDAVKQVRLVHRPAGRPFGLLVGRRRTR